LSLTIYVLLFESSSSDSVAENQKYAYLLQIPSRSKSINKYSELSTFHDQVSLSDFMGELLVSAVSLLLVALKKSVFEADEGESSIVVVRHIFSAVLGLQELSLMHFDDSLSDITLFLL